MWQEIVRFEIRYHLRGPLFYLAAAVFFLFAVLLTSTDLGVALSSAPGAANRNAPFVIVRLLAALTTLGLFVITAFVASSILRDFERGTHMLFFTKPVGKFDYLTGRFTGSMIVSLALFVVTALGLAAGRVMPWQETERVGEFIFAPYAFGTLALVLPNLLVMGAVFFAVAGWSRRMLVTYICVIVFLGLQDFAEDLATDIENSRLASLIEPMGLAALKISSKYWTAAEYNTALPGMTGDLLYNRLLWLCLGFFALALCYIRFDYSRAASKRAARRRRPEEREPELAQSPTFEGALGEHPADPTGALAALADAPASFSQGRSSQETPRAGLATVPTAAGPLRTFSVRGEWHKLLSQARLEASWIMKSTPFLVLLLFALTFIVTFTFYSGQFRGTPVYPTTHKMLESIRLSMQMFLMIVVVFYSGELVWRERSLKLSGVYDALPTPGWVFLGAKTLALALAVAVFIIVGVISTVAVQVLQGFFHLEPGLYLKGFLTITYPFLLFVPLAVFLQVISGGRFLGYLLAILYLAARYALPRLGLEHNLYRYAGHPPIPHSDMNGYGHHAGPFFWFSVYWSLGALVLLVLSVLFWVRGTQGPMRERLAAARARFTLPAKAVTAVTLVGFFAAGGYIYYSTNVLEDSVSRRALIRRFADYEKEYARYADLPLPRIAAVQADVDIYPSDRRVEVRGRYELENRGATPIRTLPVTISPRFAEGVLPLFSGVVLNRITLDAHQVCVADERLGFYVYELEDELLPGEIMEIGFDVTVRNPGFKNRRANNLVVRNGTCFANRNVFPFIGYASSNRILDPNWRRANGLPPVERMAPVNDLAARSKNYLEADWIRFETTVSTSEDQTAIAPGRLEREWIKDGRRYFHYRAQAPIINLTCYLSAEYEVRRDEWNGVAIEVYYHKDHFYNIDRLIKAAKVSLEYCTANFGPYPHGELRIAEIPNYHGLTAFAIAQTIPFSEDWGFTARIGEEDIDGVTWVTAHEISHQWWNHQLTPANVQGATMIAEALAEYTSLMVVEKTFGPEMVRRTLRHELDRYLEGRSNEQIEERPLLLVENQMYIHYNKGALVMYALKDYIGEDALNGALRRFLQANAFGSEPYTSSPELLDYIRDVVPPEYEYVTEDLFETITLFDNRVKDATFREQGDGAYLVSLQTAARKLRADGLGAETEVPIRDWIDIGIFAEEKIDGRKKEKVLYFRKHHITDTDMVFEIPVDERPTRAGIDPYNKLIDRVPDDNVKKVSETPGD